MKLIFVKRKYNEKKDDDNELKKSVTALRTKLMQRKKISNDVIVLMLTFIRGN